MFSDKIFSLIIDKISIKIKLSKDNLPVLYNESNKNICILALDQLEFSSSQQRLLFSWTVNAYVHNAMKKEIGFRQQNPNISVYYGLLYESLNDSRLLRTFQVTPYFRKAVFDNLDATEDFLNHLIESMPPSSIKGKNILMERLRPSIFTSKCLLKRNIESVDVLVSNGVALPNEVKDLSKIVTNLKAACIGSHGKVILLCTSVPPSKKKKERRTFWGY